MCFGPGEHSGEGIGGLLAPGSSWIPKEQRGISSCPWPLLSAEPKVGGGQRQRPPSLFKPVIYCLRGQGKGVGRTMDPSGFRRSPSLGEGSACSCSALSAVASRGAAGCAP